MAPRVVFIGMPGVGKSTLARALATRLNVPAVDSDALIVEETGQTISQIFATRGEAGFRELEAQVIARALDTFDGILSLGGGAITTASTRELLKEHNVVLIDGPDSLLVHRITHSHTVRPLLADDPVARIAQLRKERSELYYSVGRHVLISGQGTLEKMVDTMEKILREGREVITVGGQSPYDVVIGHNLVMEAVRCVRDYAKVFVVYSPDIAWYVHNYIEMALTGARIEYSMMELPRGESAKTYQTIEAAWDYAGKERIGRDAVVLAVGGGATTDMGGFLAATWLRGIPVVQMPTTVLAMVDAAVGGKTGINTPQGKNLVGAFYPPRRVLCDLDVLSSLPVNDMRAGFGEIVKCGFIADTQILRIVEAHGATLLHAHSEYLPELIRRAVQVKADIVARDLRESGLRENLNYGHTFAHAIERSEKYTMRHGEAVAIGCVFAAALAEASGHASSGLVDEHRNVLQRLGLPVSYTGASRTELMNAMYSDKKVRNNKLRFVVLDALGAPSRLVDPTPEMLDAAFEAVAG